METTGEECQLNSTENKQQHNDDEVKTAILASEEAYDNQAENSSSDKDIGESATDEKKKTTDEVEIPASPPVKRSRCDGGSECALENNAEQGKKDKEENKEQKELRKFRRIPIFIVDYHNEVLEFIYRCLATRHLPLKKNILVHFDSHPDMVISRDIPASASFDKDIMLAELSIENWIMPTCYAGHFDRVVWLKNSWCQQIPVGKYNFKVGQKDNKIRVDCPLDYFMSEGNYCQTSELQQASDMQLHVYNMDSTDSDNCVNPSDFLTACDGANFVLDIDLDFFSTSNPFLEIYKDANCYEQLTEIFHFEPVVKNNGSATERRKHQLEVLKHIFEHLEEERSFEGLQPPDQNIISAETMSKIENLVQSLQKHYADDEIDWLLIYDSGSTTDTNGLPHHISTDKELEQYFRNLKQFLERLPTAPVAITMACSAEDDYCPKNQVAFIEEQVLHILREVFGDRIHEKPILHYLDEDWDVMQL